MTRFGLEFCLEPQVTLLLHPVIQRLSQTRFDFPIFSLASQIVLLKGSFLRSYNSTSGRWDKNLTRRARQRFLNIHAAVYNLFNLDRHVVAAETYRYFRFRSFASWKNAAMV